MADSQVLQELLQFLTPTARQDVKGKALEYILSYTGEFYLTNLDLVLLLD